MKKTHIAFVLDSSGSMGSIRNEVVELFNKQVDTVKEEQEADTVTFTYTTFGTKSAVTNHFLGAKLNKLKKLTTDSYKPDGTTPMLDAIGQTVHLIENNLDLTDDYSVLFVIITDGQENSSKEFSRDHISKIIKEREDSGRWTFTFLAANINVHETASALNIKLANTQVFKSDSVGTQHAALNVSNGLKKYMTSRATGQSTCNDFYED